VTELRIGIDLGGTKIHGVLLAADGSFARELRVPTPVNNYSGTLAVLADLVHQLDPRQRLTVGIGTPGSLLPETQCMHNCNSTWLNGQPLLADLQSLLGERVRIANDADCFTLSEARGGAGEGADSVFGVILGTGVGGGLAINGQLLSGPSGLAGEWGHNPLPEGPGQRVGEVEIPLTSRQCYCGGLNCIETFLCGPGLARTHQELWGAALDASVIYQQANYAAGEAVALTADLNVLSTGAERTAASARQQARATLALFCRMLARSLVVLVNIVDPAVIVLGGGLSKMAAIYPPLQAQLTELVFGGYCRTRILAPVFGDASGVRGAAWLWPAHETRMSR